MKSIAFRKANLRQIKSYLRRKFSELYLTLPPSPTPSTTGQYGEYLEKLQQRLYLFGPLAQIKAANYAIDHARTALDNSHGPTIQALARCAYYRVVSDLDEVWQNMVTEVDLAKMPDAISLYMEIKQLQELIDQTVVTLPYIVDDRPLWEMVESHFVQCAGKGYPTDLIDRPGMLLLKAGMLSQASQEDLAFAYIYRRITGAPGNLHANARAAYMDVIADAMVSGMTISRTSIAKLQRYSTSGYWMRGSLPTSRE